VVDVRSVVVLPLSSKARSLTLYTFKPGPLPTQTTRGFVLSATPSCFRRHPAGGRDMVTTVRLPRQTGGRTGREGSR
jgi:hypothetical protein